MNHIAPGRNAGVYNYDEIDRRFVAERVEQFRAQVARRLSGELTEEEFKPLRLMNGLYLQLHAYMLRVAVPYGVLTSRQMRKLADIGRKYDKGYGHFTTRQNLQFNWIKLEETPEILNELAEVDMHALQTSGNCVRNVTTDQFVGAAKDEVVDGRVYAEILRQWTTLHPEFTYLPRKFKIAIMGSEKDRAAIRIHDVGVFAKRNEQGEIGFAFYAGGGLGRSPFIGKLIREWVAEEDFVAYLEAILRVYNQYGRRDNIYKARIKILVHELGQEKFTAEVEEEFARLRGPKYRLAPEIVAEIRRRFGGPSFEELPPVSAALEQAKAGNEAFARWVAVNVTEHKAPGYAVATISLKPAGGIPGDATSEQMELVADLADQYSAGEIRVSHAQNLVLAHVKQDDLFALWTALEGAGLGTANVGLIGDIIACPGLDYCALANARSIPLAQAISARFADPARQQLIGELGIKISGCINACGHHHVGAIGILGVDKKGVEFYQITIGGDPTLTTAIGDILGPAVTEDEAVDAIEAIVEVYLANRHDGESFLATLKRVGHGPFKERVYAAD
ncbi:nitrite/sulfite reductase [Azospirillum rugosum]|uniref:Sulfite reductase (NADPH) hemoprotein beta-component n=1 Tax=Azospirillum rugosum TaxID=416170 RepID=A0ABS4SEW5_9PROT|nr:nitrite/sulfite reductase [Azospirillum rugosum]MBP2290945.1 sulfite reductase (NADPH) hemoprotein beta-component [Azospirillum rugosum]MDQ0524991.1 sulfite reductase (NADPH) hemoprotein beta-component [Azospirillum rugosum]